MYAMDLSSRYVFLFSGGNFLGIPGECHFDIFVGSFNVLYANNLVTFLGGPRVEVTSTHSSLSEASGVSESSTQTYLSEMSTLVIETIENGVTK